jgi:hypothetical protein
VNIFGEIGIKENIKEAVEKYGGIIVRSEDIGKSSTSMCKSCFTLLKGINDRIKKFASRSQNAKTSSGETLGLGTSASKRTYQEQKSPACKTLSPSVKLNVPKRIRPSTSPACNIRNVQEQEKEMSHHQSGEMRVYRGSLFEKFSSSTEQSVTHSSSKSTQVKESRCHEILRFAGLRSAQVCKNGSKL